MGDYWAYVAPLDKYIWLAAGRQEYCFTGFFFLFLYSSFSNPNKFFFRYQSKIHRDEQPLVFQKMLSVSE